MARFLPFDELISYGQEPILASHITHQFIKCKKSCQNQGLSLVKSSDSWLLIGGEDSQNIFKGGTLTILNRNRFLPLGNGKNQFLPLYIGKNQFLEFASGKKQFLPLEDGKHLFLPLSIGKNRFLPLGNGKNRFLPLPITAYFSPVWRHCENGKNWFLPPPLTTQLTSIMARTSSCHSP